MWPFNRGWPLNGGPLNRGSTVYTNVIIKLRYINRKILAKGAPPICTVHSVQYSFAKF